MIFLSVAVAVLASLVLVDLVLTAAVIRRLRDTERQLGEITTPPDTGMALGDPMPGFTAPDGGITRSGLAGGPALVGVFSAGCRHCPAQAQRLAERAGQLSGRDITVLSVLGLSDGDADELSPLLRKAGHVVVEKGGGELAGTFQVEATPTFLLFDEAGVLVAKGHDLDEVVSG
jgi:hypothetical protein